MIVNGDLRGPRPRTVHPCASIRYRPAGPVWRIAMAERLPRARYEAGAVVKAVP